MIRCPTCGGLGEVKHPIPPEAGKVICPICNGAGQLAEATPALWPESPTAAEPAPVADPAPPVIDTTGTGDK